MGKQYGYFSFIFYHSSIYSVIMLHDIKSFLYYLSPIEPYNFPPRPITIDIPSGQTLVLKFCVGELFQHKSFYYQTSDF